MMERLPDHLRHFIASQINSVEQLEILLVVSESPSRSWTAQSVFKIIQSNENSIASKLQLMKRQGLVKEGEKDTFRFSPASDEIAQSVEALKEAYKISRVSIIEALFSRTS